MKVLEPDHIEVDETAIIEEGTKLWQDRLARLNDFHDREPYNPDNENANAVRDKAEALYRV